MPNLSGHMGRILLITLIVLAVILLLLFTSNKPGVISLIHDPMLYHEDSNQLIVHTSRIRRENVSKPGNFYIEQYKNTQDNTYHIISAETGEIIHSINAYTGPPSAFIAEDTLYIVNNYSPLKSTDQDSTRVASLSANQLDPFQELFTTCPTGQRLRSLSPQTILAPTNSPSKRDQRQHKFTALSSKQDTAPLSSKPPTKSSSPWLITSSSSICPPVTSHKKSISVRNNIEFHPFATVL